MNDEPKTRFDSPRPWNPMVPSCFDCRGFDEGTEYGDYGTLLSYDPGCRTRDIYDNDHFPFNIAPKRCLVNGDFQQDLFMNFFKSAFAHALDGEDETMKKAMTGFIFMMENIGAPGMDR
jgi:hypothetical protein